MSSRRDPTPWGLTASTWQALAFLLLGLLAVTNAAWFYNIRVTRAEAAAARPSPEHRRVENVVYETPERRPLPAHAPQQTSELKSVEPLAEEPLADDERCIEGQRFKRTGNGFASDPRPC